MGKKKRDKGWAEDQWLSNNLNRRYRQEGKERGEVKRGGGWGGMHFSLLSKNLSRTNE